MDNAYDDYRYEVYRGNDDGEQAVGDGTFFWARCLETDDISHGDTQAAALEHCKDVVIARLEHYAENGVPFPVVGKLKAHPPAPKVVLPEGRGYVATCHGGGNTYGEYLDKAEVIAALLKAGVEIEVEP